MKHRLVFFSLLFLALVPTALASNTWYVDGVNGSDSNDCTSPQNACKTIGHAVSLASSGDSISVAAATYTENLNIGFSLKIIGSGAKTTIIDGGGKDTVISSRNGHVMLSKVTVRNGRSVRGGGIFNDSGTTLTIDNSTISGNIAAGRVFLGAYGGGIYNLGILAVNNSTLAGNRVAIQTARSAPVSPTSVL